MDDNTIKVQNKDHAYEFDCLKKDVSEKLQRMNLETEKKTEEIQTEQRVMREQHVILQNKQVELGVQTEQVQKALSSLQDTSNAINGSLNRIYDLYKHHVEEIERLQEEVKALTVVNAKMDVATGKSDRETEDNKSEIKEINRTRKEIYVELTSLRESKADKDDVNKVLLAVERMESTLDNHCKMDEENKKTKDKSYEIKRDNVLRILALIGTIATIVSGYLIYKGWI